MTGLQSGEAAGTAFKLGAATDLKCVKPPKIAMPRMEPTAVLTLPECTPTTVPAAAPPHMALTGSSETLTLF